MTYSLKTSSDVDVFTSMGTIRSESTSMDSQLFQMPIPASPSSDTFVLDLFGVVKNITIEGIFVGSSAAISTFIGQLEGLTPGTQTYYKWASDAKGSSINVNVLTTSWNMEEGSPTKVNYNISMIETGI